MLLCREGRAYNFNVLSSSESNSGVIMVSSSCHPNVSSLHQTQLIDFES